jgi:hypothetical protein
VGFISTTYHKGIAGISHFAQVVVYPPAHVAPEWDRGHRAPADQRLQNPEWSFESYDLEHDLQLRGVADADELPNYYYRDDARMVHRVSREFIESVIGFFYENDQNVADDFELQAWLEELLNPEDGNIRGFPATLTTVAALVELLSTIIFTASGGHSSTNNGQYDMYGYIPNAPGEMKSPPPKTHEPLSEETLAEVSGVIEARNSQIDVPYTYLDPKRLYSSVEI